MGALKMGNGLDDGVALGPLVNAEGRDKVVELVDDAVGKGAKILTGGKRPDGPGFFYPATVLSNVPDSAKMLNEEIFGPVASLQTFKDEAEVIKRANDTDLRPGRLSLHQGPRPRHARLREARLRHDRPEPRPRLRSGGAVRRHEAVRHRPRGRARRADGVPGDAIHLGGQGFFYPATVLSNVPDSAKMLNEEIFGPVASLQTFKDEADVIKRANDTIYGLVAYLYTKDLTRGMRVSEKLDFGMIGLNRGLVSDPAAPFGGMKQSGIGREGAHEGLMEFLETQYIR